MLRVALILLLLILPGAPAGGQTAAFQFSFPNPGARSMGLGGAFVALADDATAALANPAGLVQLAAPEVSIEGRSWSYSTPFAESGRLSGSPTGIGLDTEAGLDIARSRADVRGLSFLSLVYPGKRWSLAVYRHRLADFEFESATRGLFADYSGGPRVPDIRGATDLELTTHAVAAAYRVSDELAVGLGVSHFGGEMRWNEDQYLWDDDTEGALYGESSYLPERLWAGGAVALDDEDWGLNAGLLWRFGERWSFGGSFRQGPELAGEGTVFIGPASTERPPGIVGAGALAVNFPDVIALGVAFRSRDGRLTVGVEVDHVAYSKLARSLDEGVEGLGEGITFTGRIDDGGEVHLGAEYAFLGTKPLLAVRWGTWFEADHLTQGFVDIGEPQFHFAAGLGAAFERFQVDLAAEFSDLVDTVSVSTIYSF